MRTKVTASQKLVGYGMYAMSLVFPLSNYPQIYQLYHTHVTSGLSLATWIMYFVFNLVPLAYAMVNRLKPLIVSNILWMIIYLIMIFGIIKYGTPLANGSYEQLLMVNNIGKAINGFGLLCISIALAIYANDLIGLTRRGGKRA
ncbi:MAG TPA: PQ-loop domain-containing transporter [Candidatus Saccharimonadia bacterium]|jgi:uncharacterized protein with PQ loop repeat|nr:PQ-loop domain-containing transporter [Candidatus Saccharimonadia bacterium]